MQREREKTERKGKGRWKEGCDRTNKSHFPIFPGRLFSPPTLCFNKYFISGLRNSVVQYVHNTKLQKMKKISARYDHTSCSIRVVHVSWFT